MDLGQGNRLKSDGANLHGAAVQSYIISSATVRALSWSNKTPIRNFPRRLHSYVDCIHSYAVNIRKIDIMITK